MEITFEFNDEHSINGILQGKEDDWTFKSKSEYFIKIFPYGIVSTSKIDYDRYFTNSTNENEKELFNRVRQLAYTFLVRKSKVHNYYTITGLAAELNSINTNENIKYLVAPIGEVHMRKFQENLYEYGWDYKHEHYINLSYTIYQVAAEYDDLGKFVRFVFTILYPSLAVNN